MNCRTPKRSGKMQLPKTPEKASNIGSTEHLRALFRRCSAAEGNQIPSAQSAPGVTEPTSRLDRQLWIHCNVCFEPYIKRRRPVYLHSCHHISCANCLIQMQADASYQCRTCEKVVRIRQIGNDMPNYLKELFHPAPWEDNLPLHRITQFQNYHRRQLESVSFSKLDELTKMRAAKMENRKVLDNLLKQQGTLRIKTMKLSQRVRQISESRQREKAKREREIVHRWDMTPPTSAEGSTSGAQRCYGFAPKPKSPETLPFEPSGQSRDFDL